MMQDRAILTLGNWSFSAGWGFGLACALSAACAGGDTPPTDTAEDLVAVAYAGGTPAGQAGSTGMGTGGSSSGTGGSGSQPSNGGSPSTPSGGTGGGASGGSAGTGAVSTGGTAGTGSTAGGCDGFAVLQARCNGSSCHGDGTGLSDFASSEENAEGFSGQQSASCGSQDNAQIFNPDNPASSLVLKKIAGTSSCNGPMPLGSPPNSLPAADIDCLEEWISNL